MRNELEKFNHSVDVLIKAYLNDTLAHSLCAACAVGNLISSACGFEVSRRVDSGVPFDGFHYKGGINTEWHKVFSTCVGKQDMNMHNYRDLAKEYIDRTGYSVDELARIELAFETAPKPFMMENDFTDSQWMFSGLMAVVDVLAEIHKVDLETKEASINQLKEAFA